MRANRVTRGVAVVTALGVACLALSTAAAADPAAKRAKVELPVKPAPKEPAKAAVAQVELTPNVRELASTPFIIADRGFPTTVVDVSVYDSWDALSDPSNNVVAIDMAAAVGFPSGTSMTMTGIGWDVIIDTVTPGHWSYMSEARMYFDDNIAPDLVGLFLKPGTGNVGVGHFFSAGILDLTDNGIPDIVLPNGMLRLEFFESYDDSNNAIDANYNVPSTITIEVLDPTATGACCEDVTGTCVGTMSQAACTATAGQTWFTGEDCATYICPVPAAGDICAVPIVVDFATDLPYSDAGQTTCGRVNDYSNTCLGSYDGGEDIIYELAVPSGVCINVAATTDATWVGLAIDGACPLAAGTCLAKDTSGSGSDVSIELLNLTAGTYYMMLDTWPSPDCINSFDLTITECPAGGACCHSGGGCDDVLDPGDCVGPGDIYMGDGTECAGVTCPSPGDDCTNPKVVTLGLSSLPYTDDNSNCGRVDDYDDPSTAHCLSYYDSGEDMIYQLTVTEAMNVRIGLDPHGTTYPGVAIGDACPPTDSCLGSDYHSSADPLDTGCVSLAPGDYYVQVDTWSTPDCIPDFTLTVTQCADSGACCHDATGTCTGTMGQAACEGTAGHTWYIGEDCATFTCPPPPADYLMDGTPVTTCSGVFADSGDTGGQYSNYEDIVKTFTPNTAGTVLQFAFTSFEVETGYDGLEIHDGNSTGAPSLGVFDTSNPPGVVTSSALDGTLTFHFTSDSSVTKAGWVATISCVVPPSGACCLTTGCEILAEAECVSAGGLYAGDDSLCDSPDCDSNGLNDFCDIAGGAPDCNNNDLPDECDVPPIGTGEDCQGDGIPDECQLTGPEPRDVIITEGFEGTFPPTGWTNVAFDVNGPWILNTNMDYVRTGVQSATHPWSTPDSADSYLLTPELTITSGTVSVWSIGCLGESWCDWYDIDVMIVVGAPGGGDDVFVGNLNSLYVDHFTTWVQGVYNLTPLLPGGTFKIGFRYTGLDGDLGVIDDVVVDGMTGPLANDCNGNQVPDECDAPVCGNDCLEGGAAGYEAEECDGTEDEACPGDCYPPGHAEECRCPFCGDGVINPGEECDTGECCTDACTLEPDTAVCREAADVCDAVEYCTGSDADCPVDSFLTDVCRLSTGPCDPAENCDGTDVGCPADVTITACADDDGCCPANCDAGNDNDCGAICGNDVLEPGEDCDGTDDAACPGKCQDACTCPLAIPTVSAWGMTVTTLLLLVAAKVYFRRRSGLIGG